jgi:transposase
LRGCAAPQAPILAAGLLRTVAGLTTAEVSVRFGVARSTAYRWLRRHREMLEREPAYASFAEEVLLSCLRADHPGVDRLPSLSDFVLRV